MFFVGVGTVARRRTRCARRSRRRSGCSPTTTLSPGSRSRRVLLVLDNLEHLHGVETVVSELLGGRRRWCWRPRARRCTSAPSGSCRSSRCPRRRRSSYSSVVRPQPDDGSKRTRRSQRSVDGSTTCRSPSNSLPHGRSCFRRPRCLSGSTPRCRCFPAAPVICRSGSGRLRATIEWSHDLLDDDARAAFRRLSVFRGSFTLDAAEAVTGADLDQVAGLLDQSLLKPLRRRSLLLARDYPRVRTRRARPGKRERRVCATARASLPGRTRSESVGAGGTAACLVRGRGGQPASVARRAHCQSAGRGGAGGRIARLVSGVRGAHTSSSASDWTRSSLRMACLKMHDRACSSRWPRPRSGSETLRGRSLPPALPSRSSSREAQITPSRFYSPRP